MGNSEGRHCSGRIDGISDHDRLPRAVLDRPSSQQQHFSSGQTQLRSQGASEKKFWKRANRVPQISRCTLDRQHDGLSSSLSPPRKALSARGTSGNRRATDASTSSRSTSCTPEKWGVISSAKGVDISEVDKFMATMKAAETTQTSSPRHGELGNTFLTPPHSIGKRDFHVEHSPTSAVGRQRSIQTGWAVEDVRSEVPPADPSSNFISTANFVPSPLHAHKEALNSPRRLTHRSMMTQSPQVMPELHSISPPQQQQATPLVFHSPPQSYYPIVNPYVPHAPYPHYCSSFPTPSNNGYATGMRSPHLTGNNHISSGSPFVAASSSYLVDAHDDAPTVIIQVFTTPEPSPSEAPCSPTSAATSSSTRPSTLLTSAEGISWRSGERWLGPQVEPGRSRWQSGVLNFDVNQLYGECSHCYDDLYKGPIVSLNIKGVKSCPHFLHHACAQNIAATPLSDSTPPQEPPRCPTCREPFQSMLRVPDYEGSVSMLEWIASVSYKAAMQLDKSEVIVALAASFPLHLDNLREVVNRLWADQVGPENKLAGVDILCGPSSSNRCGLLRQIRERVALLRHPRYQDIPNIREKPHDWFDYWVVGDTKQGRLSRQELLRALIKTLKMSQDPSEILPFKTCFNNVCETFLSTKKNIVLQGKVPSHLSASQAEEGFFERSEVAGDKGILELLFTLSVGKA